MTAPFDTQDAVEHCDNPRQGSVLAASQKAASLLIGDRVQMINDDTRSKRGIGIDL